MANREEKKELIVNPVQIGKILIVRAQFNEDITQQQLDSTVAELEKHGVEYTVMTVPGSYEIPQVVAAHHPDYSAAIAIGCLIKGESIHFEVIAYALAQQLMEMSVRLQKPVGFGVITALTKNQAQERTWLGEEAARAVLTQLSL